MQKAEKAQAAHSMVTDAEVEAAALAMAYATGRLFGAAKPADKKVLRAAARAGLYAAAMVRLEAALRKAEQNCPPDVDWYLTRPHGVE